MLLLLFPPLALALSISLTGDNYVFARDPCSAYSTFGTNSWPSVGKDVVANILGRFSRRVILPSSGFFFIPDPRIFHHEWSDFVNFALRLFSNKWWVSFDVSARACARIYIYIYIYIYTWPLHEKKNLIEVNFLQFLVRPWRPKTVRYSIVTISGSDRMMVSWGCRSGSMIMKNSFGMLSVSVIFIIIGTSGFIRDLKYSVGDQSVERKIPTITTLVIPYKCCCCFV